MALPAIDSTVSGVDANSYVTLAEATTYFEMRPGSESYRDADEHKIQAAPLYAVVLIDREVYYARKTDPAQAREFPRAGDTTMPLNVQQAQMEQALDILQYKFTEREDVLEAQSQGIRQVNTGGSMVRMLPFRPENFAAWRLCPTARELLLPYIEATIRTARA